MFGNPEPRPRRALKFYSSYAIDIRRIAAIKEGDVVTGSRTRVKIVKNKVAAPFARPSSTFLYGQGHLARRRFAPISRWAQNILEKSGSWFSYKGERASRQGRENARAFLQENKTRWPNSMRSAQGLWD